MKFEKERDVVEDGNVANQQRLLPRQLVEEGRAGNNKIH